MRQIRITNNNFLMDYAFSFMVCKLIELLKESNILQSMIFQCDPKSISWLLKEQIKIVNYALKLRLK